MEFSASRLIFLVALRRREQAVSLEAVVMSLCSGVAATQRLRVCRYVKNARRN
jgi:hypothetical protein